jgi:hypothetical protein
VGNASHRRDIAQSASETAVSNGPRWMPLPPEMNVFQREIGRDQRLMASWKLDSGAVVAYPQNALAGSAIRGFADALDEQLFG